MLFGQSYHDLKRAPHRMEDISLPIIVIPANMCLMSLLTVILHVTAIFALVSYIYDSALFKDILHIFPTTQRGLSRDSVTDELKGLVKRPKDYEAPRPSFKIGSIIEENDDLVSHLVTETTDSRGHRVVKHTFGTYEILEVYELFSPEECEHMIHIANKKGLEVSGVSSYDENVESVIDMDSRISHQTWLDDSVDPLMTMFADYTAELTELPVENQEQTQVVMYNVGGKFLDHYDACLDDGSTYCDHSNGDAGERWSTFIVYLNDEFEGGNTEFPKLGFSVKPERGKGLLFWNTDENQKILQESEHRGAEILEGKKWIATKWCHFGPFTHPE